MTEDRGHQLASRGARAAVRRERTAAFRRALGLTALSTVLPGAGLTRARTRRLGWLILLTFLVTLGWVAWFVVQRGVKNAGLYVLGRPEWLGRITIGLTLLGLVWIASIIATAIQARPEWLDRARNRLLRLFTSVMVLGVALGTGVPAAYSYVTKDTLDSLFKTSASAKPGQGAKIVDEPDVDPWRDTPRVNILVMGSDAGVNREGTRTDSMIVASIDTKTGRAVLISVPRNFEWAPLPEDSKLRLRWPGGFYGGTHDEPDCPRKAADPADPCQLNAIWTETDALRAAHPDEFRDDPVPGRTETTKIVGAVLGLKIHQTVVIDFDGFRQLIDAMGGVTINVKLSGFGGKVPIGGHKVGNRYVGIDGYFNPGVQRLNGQYALWYARSRGGDTDEYRQQRQRCVIRALVDQINPASMLTKYTSIAQILKNNVYTDIPGQSLPAFVELIERVQKAKKITSLGFSDKNGFPYSSNPDYALVRKLVQKALAPPPAKPATTPTPTPTPTSTAKPKTKPGVPTLGRPDDDCG